VENYEGKMYRPWGCEESKEFDYKVKVKCEDPLTQEQKWNVWESIWYDKDGYPNPTLNTASVDWIKERFAKAIIHNDPLDALLYSYGRMNGKDYWRKLSGMISVKDLPDGYTKVRYDPDHRDEFQKAMSDIKKNHLSSAEENFLKSITAPRKEKKMWGRKGWNEVSDRALQDVIKNQATFEHEMRARIGGCNNEITDRIENLKDKDIASLESRIDVLEHPMGEIRECWGNFYRFANKKYEIPELINKHITGFRKKGEYVEINYDEEKRFTNNPNEVPTMESRAKTFLLKDELIPLDAVVDFGDTKWQEVK
jgi:hypothetical protein